MKKMIVAAFAALGLTLGAGVASAQSMSHAAPAHNANQYNWTAGGGG